ncbi:PrsW family intramembrane metalloprotease [Kitasatospora sp. NPDC050543]|uniref:PrsW family intramembrane metalloprotease n=1 Tax=Kitasatospora sp. NPDC050543 TaxID=3364054 RepID=UPI003795EA7A
MSSPSSGGPYLWAPHLAAEDQDPPTRAVGTRTIPGPRTRRAGRLTPRPARPPAAPGPADAPPARHPAVPTVTATAVLALTGCGVLILHLVRRQTGTTGLLVGLGLALLPLPFVLGSLAWLNQTARIPMRHLMFCLAWGACAATTVAILANGWASQFLTTHGGLRGETLGAEFATPLIEESAKGAALLLLLLPLGPRLRCRTERPCAGLLRQLPSPRCAPANRPRPYGRPYARIYARIHARSYARLHFGARGGLRAVPLAGRPPGLRPYLRPLPYLRPYPLTPAHPRARSRPRTMAAGIVLGGITACGFAFTENALYLGRAFSDDQQQRLDSIGLGETPSLRDFDSTVQTFLLRGLLSPFAHPLFTALTGLGLAIALTTGRRWLARIAAPTGLLLAMALHGIWNAAADLGTNGFLLVYALLMVPCFAALVCFAAWAKARTARHRAQAGGYGFPIRATSP